MASAPKGGTMKERTTTKGWFRHLAVACLLVALAAFPAQAKRNNFV